MSNVRVTFAKGKPIHCGIDSHKETWAVVIRCEGEEIYRAEIGADTDRLINLLRRFEASEVHTVYEAGPTGFWLHDALEAAGFHSLVTPASKVPQVNDKVKTDHRDARKLAQMLEAGFLKGIHIPTPEERAHRQMYRTREQVMKHRTQTQNQIKSMLLFNGVRRPKGVRERWTQQYVRWLETLSFEHEEIQTSMGVLLKLFRWLDEQVKELDRKLQDMALRDEYRETVEIMDSVPGIGVHTAMAIELELRDVARFRKGSQLSSYLGVTPSEHSSGQTTRKGSITHCGNPRLRDLFVESSWTLIRHDPEMRRTYERIRHQSGSGKKAIVAVARRLALRVRRMLLDKKPYQIEMNKGSSDGAGGSSRPVVKAASSVGAKRFVLKQRA